MENKVIIVDLLEKNETEKVSDGQWGEWSSWSTCTKKCGGGFRDRVRQCNNPEPKGRGKPCEGEDTEGEGCNNEECEPGIE